MKHLLDTVFMKQDYVKLNRNATLIVESVQFQ